MIPHPPFDPSLLDAIEQNVGEWNGTAYRQVFTGTDVLRANIRGGRWNPPEVEVVYCSLQPRTAAAEVDHLIARQPVVIRTPRITHTLSVTLASVADDNLVIFVNNMGPNDAIDPVSEEVYPPTDPGGK